MRSKLTPHVPFVFHRPDLARGLARAAVGLDAPGGAYGVVLTGPRRTGKSTFVVEDLLPELRRQGMDAVHVDLGRNGDPGVALREALVGEAERRDVAPAAPFRGKRADPVETDAARVARGEGPSLAAVVESMAAVADGPLVLVLDEAHRAAKTRVGIAALSSVRGAMNALNGRPGFTRRGDVRIGFVLTGSDRDGLASLAVDKGRPFHGTTVAELPTLGSDYVEAYVRAVGADRVAGRRLDLEEARRAFLTVGCEPEALSRAVLRSGAGPSTEGSLSLIEAALEERDRLWLDLDARWVAMKGPQRAVLSRMVRHGADFRPFDAPSMLEYALGLGRAVTTVEVQAALDRLRETGMVVRLERGRYAPADASVPKWFSSREHDIDVASEATARWTATPRPRTHERATRPA